MPLYFNYLQVGDIVRFRNLTLKNAYSESVEREGAVNVVRQGVEGVPLGTPVVQLTAADFELLPHGKSQFRGAAMDILRDRSHFVGSTVNGVLERFPIPVHIFDSLDVESVDRDTFRERNVCGKVVYVGNVIRSFQGSRHWQFHHGRPDVYVMSQPTLGVYTRRIDRRD